jgi:hypothetical protein
VEEKVIKSILNSGFGFKNLKFSEDSTASLILFAVSLCAVISIFKFNGIIGVNDVTYAPSEIHLFDKTLLRGMPDNSAGILENVISPKYPRYAFSAQLMDIGFSLPETRLFYMIISYLLTAFLCLNICRQLEVRNPYLCSIWFLLAYVGEITFTNLGGYHFIAGTATQTYIFLPGYIAVSYCMGSKKYWNTAMIFAAFQYLIHPHPGMYAFAAIALLWLINGYSERKLSFNIWKGAALFLVVALFASLPNLLTDVNNFIEGGAYKAS